MEKNYDIDILMECCDDLTLSELIKEARSLKEISQRELARKTGVNNAVISRIEKGITKKPDFGVLMKIAFALDIHNLYRLFTLANYNPIELEKLNIRDNSNKTYINTENLRKEDMDLIKLLDLYHNNDLTMQELLLILEDVLKIDIENLLTGEDYDIYLELKERQKK